MIELISPATVGWALDVVGVIFLANSMGIRNPRRFLNEHFGVEQSQPLRAVHQQLRVKAQIFTGFLCLLLGFSMVILSEVTRGTVTRTEAPTQGQSLAALGLLALGVVVVSLLLRLAQNAWSTALFRRLLSEFFQEHTGWNFEKHPTTTREIGEILGVPGLEEDSISDYAQRVRAALRLADQGRRPAAADDAFAPLRRLGTDRRP